MEDPVKQKPAWREGGKEQGNKITARAGRIRGGFWDCLLFLHILHNSTEIKIKKKHVKRII